MSLIIPKEYIPKLSISRTQQAIKLAKDTFEHQLSQLLQLQRVSAPLFVYPETGLNDNLSGVEHPVSFYVKDAKKEVEIVQSLAKWKRQALHNYGYQPQEGLYTDMNAIRKDENLDNLHSIYVDQWDWERVITKENRTIDYLKSVVNLIYESLLNTHKAIKNNFSELTLLLPETVHFLTCEELLSQYPLLSSKERENAICKEKGSVFLIGIGDKLSNGYSHDNRAPDYDDWTLNGDLLIWYEPLQCAVELSSMGIRVDSSSMHEQLTKANALNRLYYPFHQKIIYDLLPLSIGGGIGQSRICMVLLEKIHIGEVQASVWTDEDYNLFNLHQIPIL